MEIYLQPAHAVAEVASIQPVARSDDNVGDINLIDRAVGKQLVKDYIFGRSYLCGDIE